MEIIKTVSAWGNSAGVLLPREMLGSQVKIMIIEQKGDVKQEIIRLLEPYLEDIIGIYLVGSYAREEQNQDSDVDVLAISNNTHKNIKSGKYDISISTLESVKNMLKKDPILVLPRLREAKPLVNSHLLEELKKIKVTKSSFKLFFEACRRVIKINKGFVNLDKEESDVLESEGVIYSLILRLRGIYLISCILNNKKYHRLDFERYLSKHLGNKEAKDTYKIYSEVRDDRKVSSKVTIKTAENLLELLIKEVKEYDK